MKLTILTLLAGLTFNCLADTSPRCPGEDGYYYTNHRNTNNPVAGGFVSYTATVEDSRSIVIGKLAAVCENAVILGSVNISGNAIVRGDAEVSGNSIITGEVIIEGLVKVGGKSIIKGRGTLSSGTFIDTQHVLNSSTGASSVPALASKLEQYVSTKASRLTPTSGKGYDGKMTLSQQLAFDGGCTLTIKQTRSIPGSNRFFNYRYIEETKFNLKDIEDPKEDIKAYVWSPTLSAVDFRMKNYEQKASRKWKIFVLDEPDWESGWENSHIPENSSLFASIETSTEADALAVRDIVIKLVEACKPRASSSSASALASELDQYVSTKASRLTPTGGLVYNGNVTLSQQLAFDGGCTLTIKKTRTSDYTLTSLFDVIEETRFNLKDIEDPKEDIKSYFYTPSLSVVGFRMKNYNQKASRKWKYFQNSSERDWESDWTHSHNVLGGKNSFASIETSTEADSAAVRDIVRKLVEACKK